MPRNIRGIVFAISRKTLSAIDIGRKHHYELPQGPMSVSELHAHLEAQFMRDGPALMDELTVVEVRHYEEPRFAGGCKYISATVRGPGRAKFYLCFWRVCAVEVVYEAGSVHSASMPKQVIDKVVRMSDVERSPKDVVKKTLVFKKGALPLYELVILAHTFHRSTLPETQLALDCCLYADALVRALEEVYLGLERGLSDLVCATKDDDGKWEIFEDERVDVRPLVQLFWRDKRRFRQQILDHDHGKDFNGVPDKRKIEAKIGRLTRQLERMGTS